MLCPLTKVDNGFLHFLFSSYEELNFRLTHCAVIHS